MNKEKFINDAIKRIVTEHSGGIKMVELVSELTSTMLDSFGFAPPIDAIEHAIKQCEGVSILEYTDTRYDRVKQFIYTP